MKTLALISSKGGVGKSRLGIEIAQQLGLLGHCIALADLDPHNETSSKAVKKAMLNTEALHFTLVSSPVEAKQLKADILILDTQAAWISNDQRAINLLKKCDALLIPVTPSDETLSGALETIKTLASHGYSVKQALMVSNAIANREKHIEIQTKAIDSGLEFCHAAIPALSQQLLDLHGQGKLLAGKKQPQMAAFNNQLEILAKQLSTMMGFCHV